MRQQNARLPCARDPLAPAAAIGAATPFKPALACVERASRAAIRSAQHPTPTVNPTAPPRFSHKQRRSNPHKSRAASRGSGIELSATPAPSAPAPSCKGGRRRNLNNHRRPDTFLPMAAVERIPEIQPSPPLHRDRPRKLGRPPKNESAHSTSIRVLAPSFDALSAPDPKSS